jgi:transposase
MKLEPITQLPNMMSGMWRRFGVHLFQGRITLDDMTRIEVNGTVWHRKNPGKVAEMVIIFPSEARLNDEERQRMASIVKRWEEVRVASATVVLAAGLVGSLHRSILTGMQMLAPPPHPTKVFGATPDAVSWMLPHVHTVCGTDVEGDELLAAIDDFCSTFQAARSTG